MLAYVIPEKKILISHLPKCGCQSLRAFTLDANNDTKVEDFSKFPGKNLWGYFDSTHTTKEVEKHIQEGYELISVVRSPYARLVSAYVNKILGKNYHLSDLYKEIVKEAGGDDTQRISFEEFVNVLSKGNNINRDAHWMPQTKLLAGFVDKTTVIKLENSEYLYQYLLEKTGAKYKKYIPSDNLDKVNTNIDVSKANFLELEEYILNKNQPDFECFYTVELKSKVFKMYKFDFDLLDYSA